MMTSTRFARSPSLHFDDNDLSSSPDPLATSINDENSFSRSSPHKGASSSPRKYHNTQVLQDITLSSPQKVRRRSTQQLTSPAHCQSEQFFSPWKIRVTVEAEPDEAGIERMKSMANSTTVPLRDTSSPTREPKRRGRSNSGSRKLTRKKKPAGILARHVLSSSEAKMGRLTDLDTGFLDDAEKIQIKPKRKPGSRKSKKAGKEDGIFAEEDTVSYTAQTGKDLESLKLWSKDDGRETGFEDSEAAPLQQEESPKIRALDFNRISVRSRVGPPKTASTLVAEQGPDDGKESPNAAAPASSSSTAMRSSKRQVSAASAITYPTPDTSVQDEMEASAPPSDPTEDHVGFDTILESEGFTMIDLESLPSARHFVTTPSNVEPPQTDPSAEQEGTANIEQPKAVSYPVLVPPPLLEVAPPPVSTLKSNKPPPTPIPSYLAPPEEGESDLSSTVPSSPPVDLAQHAFPRRSNPPGRSPLRQAYTPPALSQFSPKLPSPPNQPPKGREVVGAEYAKSTPPRLARVVRAGITLQGLLSPKARAPSLQPSPIPGDTKVAKRSVSLPKERLDDIFAGFDSGTRRELRAGLRFGEELAKRQRLSSPRGQFPVQGAATLLNQQDIPGDDAAWRGETLVRHSPVMCTDPQASRSASGKDWDVRLSQYSPTGEESAIRFSGDASVGSIAYLDVEARERRWQLEREAVSRQIENANTSQVIVIDSDDEEEIEAGSPITSTTQRSPTKSMVSEAEEDIWLAEAEDAQNSSRHATEDLFPPQEQLRQRERAKEAVSKPRRNLIPSPWKRGEDVESTFITNGDTSGMFWQQPKSEGRASSLCLPNSKSASRKVPKPNFDVDKMIGASLPEEERTAASEGGLPCQGLEDAREPGEKRQPLPRNVSEAFEHEEVPGDNGNGEFDAELESVSSKGEETCEASSIPPRPIMVPVNFNDSTDLSIQSGHQLQGNMQLESPPTSPCRPVTPRSAMKGSRALHAKMTESASPSRGKVAFSRRSFCLDDKGVETGMQVLRDTLSPESSIASNPTHDCEVEASNENKEWPADGAFKCLRPVDAPVAPAANPSTTSWFSRLTGWGSKPNTAASTTEAHKRQLQPSSKPLHTDSNDQSQSTPTALPPPNLAAFNARFASSQFVAHATDPRIPPPPETMRVSGYFSDCHFKHLKILWLKSLKATFTIPGSVRPGLEKYIGKKCLTPSGEFAWEITRTDVEVVERWFRLFEGREAKEEVGDWADRKGRYRKVEWSEWDVCMRLFTIVVGQELRREEREKDGKAFKKR